MVWFLGALVRVRASADATAGTLDLLEHQGERVLRPGLHEVAGLGMRATTGMMRVVMR